MICLPPIAAPDFRRPAAAAGSAVKRCKRLHCKLARPDVSAYIGPANRSPQPGGTHDTDRRRTAVRRLLRECPCRFAGPCGVPERRAGDAGPVCRL
ncbi:MAG: hypothetical protein D6754_05325, partial [Alphaproteobacteria bacterium]